jgi:hypothetical protein
MVDLASLAEVLKNDSFKLVVLGALLIAGRLFFKWFVTPITKRFLFFN